MSTRNIRRADDGRHGGPVEWPVQWGTETSANLTYTSAVFWAFCAVACLAGAVDETMPGRFATAAVCAVFAGFYLTNVTRQRGTPSTRIMTISVDPETGRALGDEYVPGSMGTVVPARPVVRTACAAITTLLATGFVFTFWSEMHSAGAYPVAKVAVATVVSGLVLFGVVYTARLLRNPFRIVATPDTLWVHRTFSSDGISWNDVTAVEPTGRRLPSLRSRRSEARERVLPGIEIGCGERNVRVNPLAHDIDPAVLLHLLQTLHMSPETRAWTADGRTVEALTDLYSWRDEEYR
ncbi:hypothetical protein [Rhodococcus gannanensis]|uniref:PH domain-containing protein n=1 Tax=Rhodococcus gannanensis TaxID=1960308 RepID=A0ABW4NX97_9NOCA